MATSEEKKDGQQEETVEETQGSENQGTGASTGKDGTDGGTGGGTETGSGKQEKTFNQDQVNRMMTREKNQGRAAALKELGIDPKDTKAMAMVKAFIESQKTDEQKDAEQKAANARTEQENARRILVAEAKAEAMVAGVQPKFVDDIVTLVVAKMGDDTDLKTLIGEFKTKYPTWFEAGDEDDKGGKDGSGSKKTGQRGTGSSVKGDSGSKGGKDDKGLGARLAAQRKSSSGKKSYWGNR